MNYLRHIFDYLPCFFNFLREVFYHAQKKYFFRRKRFFKKPLAALFVKNKNTALLYKEFRRLTAATQHRHIRENNWKLMNALPIVHSARAAKINLHRTYFPHTGGIKNPCRKHCCIRHGNSVSLYGPLSQRRFLLFLLKSRIRTLRNLMPGP